MIAGLLLAAGFSTRFGSDKLTAKVGGQAIVRRSVACLAPTDAIYVVVPPAADTLMQALSRMDVAFVVNLARREGMGASIRAGIEALPAEVEGVVIALADQPFASAEVTRALCARFRAGGVAAVVPAYADGRGHPVLFGRECFASLLELKGDRGGREVLDALGDRLSLLDISTPSPVDVDTADALHELEKARTADQH